MFLLCHHVRRTYKLLQFQRRGPESSLKAQRKGEGKTKAMTSFLSNWWALELLRRKMTLQPFVGRTEEPREGGSGGWRWWESERSCVRARRAGTAKETRTTKGLEESVGSPSDYAGRKGDMCPKDGVREGPGGGGRCGEDDLGLQCVTLKPREFLWGKKTRRDPGLGQSALYSGHVPEQQE